MNLKRNLKRILADRDMTAAQLARKSGVPKTTLAEWLAGGNPRDLHKVKSVASALDLTVDSLCFGDGQPFQQSIEKHLDGLHIGKFEVVLKPLK